MPTAWHITFGTYGTRLHGDPRFTVDRQHNERGEPFLEPNIKRHRTEHDLLRRQIVKLSPEQQLFIEDTIPDLCTKGGWAFQTCAAAPDHVHTLLSADTAIHGKDVRRWLKRWLGQALNRNYGQRAGIIAWWAEGGSTKPVKDEAYFANVVRYIHEQRCSRD